MNKYQEALNNLDNIICELSCELKQDYELYTRETGYEKYSYILQELIDQNKPLTLDECIQEWEEKGWKVKKTKSRNNEKIIYITKYNECYCDFDEIAIVINTGMTTVNCTLFDDLIHLLSKTLKALEIK